MDVEGVCQVCSYSIDNGCYFCSPQDPSICEICKSGYYMDTGNII